MNEQIQGLSEKVEDALRDVEWKEVFRACDDESVDSEELQTTLRTLRVALKSVDDATERSKELDATQGEFAPWLLGAQDGRHQSPRSGPVSLLAEINEYGTCSPERSPLRRKGSPLRRASAPGAVAGPSGASALPDLVYVDVDSAVPPREPLPPVLLAGGARPPSSIQKDVRERLGELIGVMSSARTRASSFQRMDPPSNREADGKPTTKEQLDGLLEKLEQARDDYDKANKPRPAAPPPIEPPNSSRTGTETVPEKDQEPDPPPQASVKQVDMGEMIDGIQAAILQGFREAAEKPLAERAGREITVDGITATLEQGFKAAEDRAKRRAAEELSTAAQKRETDLKKREADAQALLNRVEEEKSKFQEWIPEAVSLKAQDAVNLMVNEVAAKSKMEAEAAAESVRQAEEARKREEQQKLLFDMRKEAQKEKLNDWVSRCRALCRRAHVT